MQSKGLGDTIQKITKATGIHKAVKMINKDKDCGCGERKDALNKLFPYKKSISYCKQRTERLFNTSRV